MFVYLAHASMYSRTHPHPNPITIPPLQEVMRVERQSNRMAVYRIGLSSEGKSAGMFYFGWINST